MQKQTLTSNISHATSTAYSQYATMQEPARSLTKRCFCPGTSCFTDEMVVRRVSSQSDIWLLTDEIDNQSWLMKAEVPVCPHCGSTLLA